MKDKSSILIVDDVPENLKVLEAILQANEYQVRAAINGKVALRSASATPPDLILLDINMPEMTGFEVCEKLKADPFLKNIPVIFISAADNISDKLKAFASGGVDYISKPFQAEEVMARVNTHLINSKYQKELKEKNDQLNLLNATKDKFFSIIAHDLKSPLAGSIGLMNILLRDPSRFSSDDIKRHLTMVNNSTQTIFNLLVVLLEWAQTQTGRISFKPQRIDLLQLVKNNIELFQNVSDKKEVKINLLTEGEGVFNVFVDENMINTVIRNLINNAIKYSHPKESIEIKIENIEKDFKVSVTDRGIGIEEKDIGKLFRIDSRLRVDGTNAEKGTGLGLIICKEFLERNNSQIGVTSELGRGSTFHFSLPKQ